MSSVKPSTSINKPQLCGTFLAAETMAVSAEEKDLFYGGPVPLKLDVKEEKAFKIYNRKHDFDRYFKKADDAIKSFQLSLEQVSFTYSLFETIGMFSLSNKIMTFLETC